MNISVGSFYKKNFKKLVVLELPPEDNKDTDVESSESEYEPNIENGDDSEQTDEYYAFDEDDVASEYDNDKSEESKREKSTVKRSGGKGKG